MRHRYHLDCEILQVAHQSHVMDGLLLPRRTSPPTISLPIPLYPLQCQCSSSTLHEVSKLSRFEPLNPQRSAGFNRNLRSKTPPWYGRLSALKHHLQADFKFHLVHACGLCACPCLPCVPASTTGVDRTRSSPICSSQGRTTS